MGIGDWFRPKGPAAPSQSEAVTDAVRPAETPMDISMDVEGADPALTEMAQRVFDSMESGYRGIVAKIQQGGAAFLDGVKAIDLAAGADTAATEAAAINVGAYGLEDFGAGGVDAYFATKFWREVFGVEEQTAQGGENGQQ